MKVIQLLKALEPTEKVDVVITAYGIYYGSSVCDDLDTAADCLEHLAYDAKVAKVTRVKVNRHSQGSRLIIVGEVCK